MKKHSSTLAASRSEATKNRFLGGRQSVQRKAAGVPQGTSPWRRNSSPAPVKTQHPGTTTPPSPDAQKPTALSMSTSPESFSNAQENREGSISSETVSEQSAPEEPLHSSCPKISLDKVDSSEKPMPEWIKEKFEEMGIAGNALDLYKLIKEEAKAEIQSAPQTPTTPICMSESTADWAAAIKKDESKGNRFNRAADRRGQNMATRAKSGQTEHKMDAWAERRMKNQTLKRRKSLPARVNKPGRFTPAVTSSPRAGQGLSKRKIERESTPGSDGGGVWQSKNLKLRRNRFSRGEVGTVRIPDSQTGTQTLRRRHTIGSTNPPNPAVSTLKTSKRPKLSVQIFADKINKARKARSPMVHEKKGFNVDEHPVYDSRESSPALCQGAKSPVSPFLYNNGGGRRLRASDDEQKNSSPSPVTRQRSASGPVLKGPNPCHSHPSTPGKSPSPVVMNNSAALAGSDSVWSIQASETNLWDPAQLATTPPKDRSDGGNQQHQDIRQQRSESGPERGRRLFDRADLRKNSKMVVLKGKRRSADVSTENKWCPIEVSPPRMKFSDIA